jgi:hypothetical protein
MNHWCIFLFFMHMLTKCTVQGAKSPVKNIVRERCAEEINYGVKGLIYIIPYFRHHVHSLYPNNDLLSNPAVLRSTLFISTNYRRLSAAVVTSRWRYLKRKASWLNRKYFQLRYLQPKSVQHNKEREIFHVRKFPAAKLSLSESQPSSRYKVNKMAAHHLIALYNLLGWCRPSRGRLTLLVISTEQEE